ncbi:MAG: S10 family peptidase [Bacteroidota bacterium]
MKTKLLFLFLLITAFAMAQEKKESKPADDTDPPLSKTQGRVTIGGKVIDYTATTGYMILRDESGKAKGKIFFVYYQKDNEPDPSKRPITFTFNGGPGSASVWLHMGGLGPRRIEMTEFGAPTMPPYRVIDNEYSWLDETDLIFIDPVMTGYSRPAEGVDKKEFTGYVEDIESVGQFIHLATSRFQRWNSPKFLCGESYGTTRATGLSGHLQDRYGMYLNGVVLVSSILNFQTARFGKGNDLPFVLFLPTYSAIAWYHKKLGAEFPNLKALLPEVEKFAIGEYATALMKGDQLTASEKQSVIDKLNRFTGLDKTFLEQTNMRIEIGMFAKELRRADGYTVGRLDGRFTGMDYDDAGERYEFDPSNVAITGPFAMAINDYVRRTLKYTNDIPYEVLGNRVAPWNYNNVQNQYLNTGETLRQAIHKNPALKVLIFNGYYDLATPYYATDYTVNHLFVDPSLRSNISQTFYEAGHMMYIHLPSIQKLKKDISDFYQKTLKK